MPVNRMPKVRVSEPVSFIAFTLVCGFFTALEFTALLLVSRNLGKFPFVLSDVMYDGCGEPRAWISRTLSTVLVVSSALLFALSGHLICGIAMAVAAVMDLSEERVDFMEFIRKIMGR